MPATLATKATSVSTEPVPPGSNSSQHLRSQTAIVRRDMTILAAAAAKHKLDKHKLDQSRFPLRDIYTTPVAKSNVNRYHEGKTESHGTISFTAKPTASHQWQRSSSRAQTQRRARPTIHFPPFLILDSPRDSKLNRVCREPELVVDGKTSEGHETKAK